MTISEMNRPGVDTQPDDNALENGQAFVEDDILAKCCRICLDTENTQDMIAPCRCKGSSKLVHRKCLDQWRAYNADDLAFSRCMECQFTFQFEAVPNDSEKHQKYLRCLLYWLLVSRDVIIVTVVVQVFILLFALLFWLAVRNEEGVVEWVDETYQEPVCVSAGCQFWSCYAVGLLFLFLCLGIWGSVLLCLNGCSVGAAIHAGGATRSVGHARSTHPGMYVAEGVTNSRTTDWECCRSCGACCESGCGGGGGCDGEGGMFCLALLLVVGVVLTVVGFVLAAIVSVLVVQMIVRRHFWILQKRNLVKDYRVRDLSTDPASLLENAPSSPSQRNLQAIETDRLVKLGLFPEN